MKTNKKGFTLVELMVVVIIVGILAAVAVPLMTANKDKAIASEAVAALSGINTACKLYKVESGSVPSSFDNLTDSGHFDPADLEGTYFSDAGAYSSITIDTSLNKVTAATATMTAADGTTKTYTLAWSTDTKAYTMKVATQ